MDKAARVSSRAAQARSPIAIPTMPVGTASIQVAQPLIHTDSRIDINNHDPLLEKAYDALR